MRLSRALPALAATTLALPGTAYSLVPGGHAPPRPSSRLHSTPSAEDMQRAMKEQSENPEVLAQSAAAMKNMTPEDMEKLIAQMEGMPASERESLKKVGMNPDTMLASMKMMKDNPQMMATAQKLMSNMTPEQMLEQSRAAQEKMQSLSKEELEEAAEAAKRQMENMDPETVDQAVKAMADVTPGGGGGPQPLPEGVVAKSAADPNVVDAMFRVGELMSRPPSGGVTFQAFATLPPVAVLSGEREQDLSRAELAECWADGAHGAARADRAAFGRVWDEVREYFEEDVMAEARATSAPKAKKRRAADATADVEVVGAPPSSSAAAGPGPTIGAGLNEAQIQAMNEQVKKMSDDDMTKMLESMANIGPEEEARMRAMGADPAMMKKAAEMMKDNPMMRGAAKMMMKNMSPDQMLKTSQQAQEQMKNMSSEDMQRAMDQMKNAGK